MNIEHLSHYSGNLGREMALNRYGHAGLPTKNIKLNVVADGEHSEECWAKYLPECLRFISEEW